MNLADVLTVRGRATQAASAIQQALGLYEQKEIDVSADKARSLLAEPVALGIPPAHRA